MSEDKAKNTEYPKWVEPHASHVENVNGNISAPEFECHVTRDRVVTVLVSDAGEEAKATSDKKAPEEPKAEENNGNKEG